jgi:hypothetical protein
MEVEEHYGLLLGIHPPWEISQVKLKTKTAFWDTHFLKLDTTLDQR